MLPFYFPKRGGFLRLLTIWMLLSGMVGVSAPPDPKPNSRNLIYNGSFERFSTSPNLWDGVDSSGNLKVMRGNSIVLNRETGNSYTPMPFGPSISFVDVNGDGLPDLIVASSLGYLYWYPNVGRKGQPVFQHANLVQTNLGTGARIHAVDWNNDGKVDILFGNIQGDINLLLNQGTATDPKWVSSMGKPRWFPPPPWPHPQIGAQAPKIMEAGQPLNIGNYSAPIFYDWNGDGLPDLICGEGSYSANSISIWLNVGSKSNPSFRSDQKFTLAYGDGHEILAPCVYDWNGDGIPDLIVGDRDGEVLLYLGTKESTAVPNKIAPIELTKLIKIGNDEKMNYVMSVCVCDFNDDGIPDILYGTAGGTLMVALGSGDRKNPTILPGKAIKGIDLAMDFKQPSNWDDAPMIGARESGLPFNTSAPIAQVVSQEDDPASTPRDGKYAFKLSWYDKFFGWFMLENTGLPGLNGYTEGVYAMTTPIIQFTMGKEYELSFWRKGEDMKISYLIYYNEEVPDLKNPKGAPSLVDHRFTDLVAVNSAWNQYRKTYRLIGTKEKHFDSNGQPSTGSLEISFYGKGTVYLDDVKLVEIMK